MLEERLKRSEGERGQNVGSFQTVFYDFEREKLIGKFKKAEKNHINISGLEAVDMNV